MISQIVLINKINVKNDNDHLLDLIAIQQAQPKDGSTYENPMQDEDNKDGED